MKMLDHSGIALDQASTLPVDLEDDVAPLGELLLHRPAAGAIEVVEDLRVFQELALGDQLLELRHAHEVVLAPRLLGRAPGASRMRDRNVKLWMALEQRLHQRRLPRPGRRSDYEQAATAAIFPGYRHRSLITSRARAE
jgi:hypothetical protein